MRTLRTTVVILGLVTAGTTVGLARAHDDQDLPPLAARAIPLAAHAIQAPELSTSDWARRQDELEKWIHDFSEWKAWVDPVGKSARTWLVQ